MAEHVKRYSRKAWYWQVKRAAFCFNPNTERWRTKAWLAEPARFHLGQHAYEEFNPGRRVRLAHPSALRGGDRRAWLNYSAHVRRRTPEGDTPDIRVPGFIVGSPRLRLFAESEVTFVEPDELEWL